MPKLVELFLSENDLNGTLPHSICNMQNLTALSLRSNHFSGELPHAWNSGSMISIVDAAQQSLWRLPAWIGGSGGSMLHMLQLRNNSFTGHIPQQLCNLGYLHILDLSHNNFSGKIPSEVGNLLGLKSLDLSHNHLSGHIPQSLASLTFLSHLNLSYSNLVGRIPSGNQLQTLTDSSIYIDNPSLCGFPLPTKCPGDDTFTATNSNEDGNDKLWFYVSIVLGFVIGFWGVCGTLIVKKSWRYTYFRFVDDIKDKVTLAIALKVAHLQRKFCHV
ncbi:hypothetical protein L3X38_022578 [Prunus dulcis]|uniref:Disease resistance family protein / LRR family protein n=1 Tax=Prunus dulcis TaxID=3755 RepID=A0AAD4VXW4_PRUDU|nr:hypothetical protein L3X38_022578 [Prunus dulcis]